METFAIPPDQDSYAAEPGQEVVTTELSGGFSRSRRDIMGAVWQVNVRWKLSPQAYRYAWAFYNTIAEKGANPFYISLLLDDPIPNTYEAKFKPGTFKLNSVRGHEHTVSAQLEVKPLDNDTEADEVYVMLYALYGENYRHMMEGFDRLANVEMPKRLS